MSAMTIQVKYDELGAIENRFHDQAKSVDTLLNTLHTSYDQVHRTWTGDNADAFFRDMEQNVFPALARLSKALSQSGMTTHNIGVLFQNAEQDAATLLNNSGAASGKGLSGFPGGGGGGGASGDAKKEEEIPLSFAKFPTTLVQGIRADVYARVAAGTMTEEQADKLFKEMQKNPQDPRWKDYIEAKVTLYEHRDVQDHSLFNGTISSSLGSVKGDLFGYETTQQAWVGIDKDGLGASGEIGGQAYVARLREELNIGDLNVKTDTTVLSAEAKLKGQFSVGPHGVGGELSGNVDLNLINSRVDAKIGGLEAAGQVQAGLMLDGKVKGEFNPLNGNAGVDAEGNVFVGIRERVQATYKLGFLKVGAQGELDQGVGVGGKAKVGFEDGVFRFDVGAYASDGVGAGGGVIVEVDAKEAGKEIVDAVNAGYHWMFGK